MKNYAKSHIGSQCSFENEKCKRFWPLPIEDRCQSQDTGVQTNIHSFPTFLKRRTISRYVLLPQFLAIGNKRAWRDVCLFLLHFWNISSSRALFQVVSKCILELLTKWCALPSLKALWRCQHNGSYLRLVADGVLAGGHHFLREYEL